jgi:hypothetical protein
MKRPVTVDYAQIYFNDAKTFKPAPSPKVAPPWAHDPASW